MPSESSKWGVWCDKETTGLIYQTPTYFFFLGDTALRQENCDPVDISHPKYLGWEAKVAPLELVEWKE